MKFKYLLAFVLLIAAINQLFSQPITERYKHLGKIFTPQFTSAPFPHANRAAGHTYHNELFSYQEHYADSSVLIFVPKGFKTTATTNFVVYFHGWRNNIDSACAQFKLIEQFSESKKSAVFVFPEGPKNSPDSFGGKMEDKNGVKNLLADVVNYLKKKKIVNSTKIGKIILAGHSGAYSAIAYSVEQGGISKNISDVILFDALYAGTDKFLNWIQNYKGRFVNIYTDNGGTVEETEKLMNDLDSLKISYLLTKDKELVQKELVKNRLVFIHTDLSHNEVIAARNQFRDYLKTSKVSSLK